jgi:demethylmenaquinone methyltransferase / 2-methoxy-6-polyprenyl-1,4-benzoquinol methylase
MIAAQKQSPLPGTRPEGSHDEREASARVRDMFTRIAPRYDFLNHLLSFSIDRIWRRRTAQRFIEILRRPDARVLDLCCGTGDLAFALDRARSRALRRITGEQPARSEGTLGGRSFSSDMKAVSSSGVSTPEASSNPCPVVGSDFVEPMLTRARHKAQMANRSVVFAAADALHLPFPHSSFDLVATAFGFRNLANYEQGLLEIARVLKQGGEVGILEFTEPASGPMAGLFRFYFKHILPRIGGAISGNAEAYKYLPGSVAKFPSSPELAALMERTGFAAVRIASWNFGSVILHSATRV